MEVLRSFRKSPKPAITTVLVLGIEPNDAALVDRPSLLRDIAQTLDIDPDEIIKSEERLQAEQALQNQMLAGAGTGGDGTPPQPSMGPNIGPAGSRLVDARERLEQADETNFRFEQGRVHELRFFLELEDTAKAVLDRERTLSEYPQLINGHPRWLEENIG